MSRAVRRRVISKFNISDGSIIVITGANRGLGEELAKLFIIDGFVVVNLAREKATYIHERLVNVTCDVSSYDQVKQAAQYITENIGIPNILVNNAGVAQFDSIDNMSIDAIEETIDVNLRAHFYTTKTFLGGMKKSNKRCWIVTVSSALGYLSPAFLAAYGASKAGAVAFHESLTAELRYTNQNLKISTLLVTPGQLDTQMFKDVTANRLFAPVVSKEQAAKAVYHSMQEGACHCALPFYVRFLPIVRCLPDFLARFLRYASGMDQSAYNAVSVH
ncbi:hypothetical protein CANCADRAFT_30740 [Tortispora caseinolytica NRRL Y-17796]|uniref:Uncharacterized protein n=1 Tax=Tortispora caseinolytica NRRL Y-17796 TaxID=767744 RepID=A0A1E4TLL0_9ASCO|nr:hypothetical protein CANCADRAFT_30740 [Tortispora caseinolytica NRRL Y-17796]